MHAWCEATPKLPSKSTRPSLAIPQKRTSHSNRQPQSWLREESSCDSEEEAAFLGCRATLAQWETKHNDRAAAALLPCASAEFLQRSSLRGDDPQSGQRMRGSEAPRLFSSSSSRSKTTEDLATSFKTVEVPASEKTILSLSKLH